MDTLYWVGALTCFACAFMYVERGQMLMTHGTQGVGAFVTRLGHFFVLFFLALAFVALAFTGSTGWFRPCVAAAVAVELVGHLWMRVIGSPPT
jgi:hypothetical protein